MTNISELFAQAQATGIDNNDRSEYYRPEEGKYVVKVVETRPGKTRDGSQDRIGIWLEIADEAHPDNGERWWDNIVFGGKAQANAINFGKLLGLGVEEDQIAKLGTVEAIAGFINDATAGATVKHNTRGENTYVNTYFSRKVEDHKFQGEQETAPSAPAPSTAGGGEGW